MENGIICSYSIKDTIFADDNAILSLLYILVFRSVEQPKTTRNTQA